MFDNKMDVTEERIGAFLEFVQTEKKKVLGWGPANTNKCSNIQITRAPEEEERDRY